MSNKKGTILTLGDQELSDLLDEQELSRITRKSIVTLRRYRKLGGGPQYLRIGRHIRYRKEDVLAWFALCAV